MTLPYENNTKQLDPTEDTNGIRNSKTISPIKKLCTFATSERAKMANG
jgi:hypothetical protein